jgi:Zn-dependent protease with chaperone function
MRKFSQARHKFENLALVASVLVVFALLYFFYGLEPWITVGAILFTLFYIRLMQGQYLGNALQVTNKHFFRIKQIVEQQADKLHIREPKVFITQDPVPNAYTLGFYNPYTIVLSSGLVEGLTEAELEAVLAHELGHVKFHHSRISSLISPAGRDILLLNWIFGFWNRMSEISADTISLFVTENPRALITALVKISIGPRFLEQIDEEELLKQSKEVKQNHLNKWGELLNTHPYLTTRIHNLLSLAKQEALPYYKGGNMYCIHCGKTISVAAKFCPKCGVNLRKELSIN